MARYAIRCVYYFAICIFFVIVACFMRHIFYVIHDRYAMFGFATYYGLDFHRNTTASGESYDVSKLTAAHRRLPFGTKIRVTNIHNEKKVEVVVNDRGPFKKGIILDLSYEAARRIDLIEPGKVVVRIEVIDLPQKK